MKFAEGKTSQPPCARPPCRATETLRPIIEALPEVVAEVNNCIPVFVDGGIRRGQLNRSETCPIYSNEEHRFNEVF